MSTDEGSVKVAEPKRKRIDTNGVKPKRVRSIRKHAAVNPTLSDKDASQSKVQITDGKPLDFSFLDGFMMQPEKSAVFVVCVQDKPQGEALVFLNTPATEMITLFVPNAHSTVVYMDAARTRRVLHVGRTCLDLVHLLEPYGDKQSPITLYL